MDAFTTLVNCSGHQHRISWSEGTFSFLDHDLEAERTLYALGGGLSACLLVEKLWRAPDRQSLAWLPQEHVPGLLPIADSLARLGGPAVLRSGQRVDLTSTRTVLARRMQLEQLPPELRAALMWEASGSRPHRNSRSDDGLREDVFRAVRSTAPGEVDVRCVLTEANAHPRVSGWIPASGPGVVSVWIRRTWSSGQRIHDGRFILGPRVARHDRYRQLEVHWEPTEGGLRAVAHHVDLLGDQTIN